MARASTWDTVRLFDWVYPTEASYQLLADSARSAGKTGWLVDRMARQEKLPQAAAKDLAYELVASPNLDEAAKERLKEAFQDESKDLKASNTKSDDLAERLAAVSRKMDDLEAAVALNNYAKTSNPSLVTTIYSGNRLENTGGVTVPAAHRNYLFAGASFGFTGQVGGGTFGTSFGYDYFDNDNGTYISTKGAGLTIGGVTVLLPFGDGVLSTRLGGGYSAKMSELLFSDLGTAPKDSFFTNPADNYKPKVQVKVLDIDYPSQNKYTQNIIYIERQGTGEWWPFSHAQFFYGPNNTQWFYTYNPDTTNETAGRLDLALGSVGFFDDLRMYSVMTHAENDRDQLTASPPGAIVFQTSNGTELGTEMTFQGGGTARFSYALSHFEAHPTIKENYPYDDSAYLGALAYPIMGLNTALEFGMAGPYFFTISRKGQFDAHAQLGATMDSSYDINAALPPAASNIAFQTLVIEPAGLANNSQRLAVKTEWQGSFLSWGLMVGSNTNILPTTAIVEFAPVLENRSDNGYAWMRTLGGTYSGPAANNYNNASAKSAIRPNGTTDAAAKWSQYYQKAYRRIYFTTLISDGPYSNRLLADSIKSVNQAELTTRLDFRSLIDRSLPFDLIFTGQLRDVAPQMGFPATDDSSFLQQSVGSAFLTFGLTETLNFLAMAGYEDWSSNKTPKPFHGIAKQAGVGFDLSLDSLINGLLMQLRVDSYEHVDLIYPDKRAWSMWGGTLSTIYSY